MKENNFQNNQGALVISLDFELLWGVFDKVDYTERAKYFENTKKVIPKILLLFEKYGVHATWATVGMLFNKDWEEWNANFPAIIPRYKNEKLNPYKFGRSIDKSKSQNICFAPELIDLIKISPGQEMATHTYSHYYCKEEGQNSEMFRSDLQKAIGLAKSINIDLKSLVFPRNQFNGEYVEVCQELGIENIRTNPSNWYWQNPEQGSIVQKIFRSGDAYIGIYDKSYKASEIIYSSRVTSQMASRMLRPISNNHLLERIKIGRIKKEITKAAKKSEVYHLWWHPHNFGNNPEASLIQLEEILIHFKYCENRYGFESKNMQEIGLNTKKING